MFGHWIKLQNTLKNQSIEESISEQVGAEYREERERRREGTQRAEAEQRGAAGVPGGGVLCCFCYCFVLSLAN